MRGHRLVSDQDLPIRMRCIPDQLGIWSILSGNALNARSRPRGAMRPSSSMKLPRKEGMGNAGCPLHPRPRVHLVVVERTPGTTRTPESPDVPARNGFNGFLRALPGDRALLPPSSADVSCLSPVGPT